MGLDAPQILALSVALMFASVTLRSVASRLALKSVRPPVNVVVEEPNAKEKVLSEAAKAAHADAMKLSQDTYIDPDTGLTVFTRAAHIRRGRCCGSYCRHCPYGHVNVPALKQTVVAPATPAVTEHHASVYTKTGDKGTSALFTGERRSKADAIFDALGTVDELNSFVGAAAAEVSAPDDELVVTLQWIQRRLLDVGSVVATPGGAPQIQTYEPDQWTMRVEKEIDKMDAKLPPLVEFILPGGGRAAAALHVCRSVTRRAERQLIAARESDPRLDTEAFKASCRFVNRLSDFFFVAARSVSSTPDQRRSAHE